jgi:hypothetical protein
MIGSQLGAGHKKQPSDMEMLLNSARKNSARKNNMNSGRKPNLNLMAKGSVKVGLNRKRKNSIVPVEMAGI